MKFEFELKSVKVNVEGEMPEALTQLIGELAAVARVELKKLEAKAKPEAGSE